MYTLKDFILERVDAGDKYAIEWLYGEDTKEINESLNESKGDRKMFKAFITNLGKYNEGELEGEWLEFPCTEEQFEDCLKRIGIGSTDEFGQPYEEYFVTDYDGGFGGYDELGEYPTYEELNDFGEKLEELSNLDEAYGEGFVSALLKNEDIDYVLDHIDDMTVIETSGWGDNYADIAYYYVDDAMGGVDQLDKETIETYFDYDALGRDLGFDSYENDDYDPDDPDSEEYISAGEYWCGDEYASDQEIGEAFVEQVGMDGVANLEYYFDYDAYGRDIAINDGYYQITTDDYTRYWVCIYG